MVQFSLGKSFLRFTFGVEPFNKKIIKIKFIFYFVSRIFLIFNIIYQLTFK